MKIVINNQYGGFNLSSLAIKEYLKLKGQKAYLYDIEIKEKEIYYKKTDKNQNEIFNGCFTKDFGTEFLSKDISDEEWEKYSFSSSNIDRTDKDLIEVIEKLKDKANTICSTLKVIEIPDDVDWIIEEYDGNEWVAEKHRTWS